MVETVHCRSSEGSEVRNPKCPEKLDILICFAQACPSRRSATSGQQQMSRRICEDNHVFTHCKPTKCLKCLTDPPLPCKRRLISERVEGCYGEGVFVAAHQHFAQLTALLSILHRFRAKFSSIHNSGVAGQPL